MLVVNSSLPDELKQCEKYIRIGRVSTSKLDITIDSIGAVEGFFTLILSILMILSVNGWVEKPFCSH